MKKTVTAEEVSWMQAASNESFGYNVDPIVSSDIIGVEFGSLFDATQTKVLTVGDKQLVRFVSLVRQWEMCYTSQLVKHSKNTLGLIK